VLEEGGTISETWRLGEVVITGRAVRAADVAARVMALTGVDLLTDPELVGEARAFFEEATGGEPYRSPIPQDQKPPVP